MALSCKFAVLRVVPDPRRGETVNVGLVIFTESGVDVRILKTLAKVSALDAKVDLEQLRNLPERIADWTKTEQAADARHSLLRNFGVVTVSELGEFEIANRSRYEDKVAQLMRTLVNPVANERNLQGNTRLKTTLRKKFLASKLLGMSETDITRHLVVPNYPIDADEGLYADFALKNGVYHVTETADLRAEHVSGIAGVRLASLAAIKFHKAKDSFGPKTRRFAVYAARSSVSPQAINLLGEYSDAIFDINSREDMVRYMEIIAEAAQLSSKRPARVS